jgi:hypothetical protein
VKRSGCEAITLFEKREMIDEGKVQAQKDTKTPTLNKQLKLLRNCKEITYL